MKIVSVEDVPGLKSEKKKEYKTSGSIKILFTEQLIRPFMAQTIGSAAIATRRMLQTMQLFSKLKKALLMKYIIENTSTPAQTNNKCKSFFLFWDV
jgi:hypothetical protein